MRCKDFIPLASIRPTILPSKCPFQLVQARGLRVRPKTGIPAPDNNEINKVRTLERMPFQTYQLALDVIKRDREEKVTEIGLMNARIANTLKARPNASLKDKKIQSMRKHLEYLRIQADINNPRVKYNFDRGIIGMKKPVYRFLLDRKWREYRRPVLIQRLTQMNIVPDVLPTIDPVVDVQVRFKGRDLQPGIIADSAQTESHPTLKIITFDKSEALYTVAVVDPDVPDVKNDRFGYRLHWLVSNISISPKQSQAVGTGAKPSDTLLSWLPPHVQKGSPYHRYAMFVFRQENRLDPATVGGKIKRDGFVLRSFKDKQKLEPVGAFMWRAVWDENTKEVMQRNVIPGWEKMLVREFD